MKTALVSLLVGVAWIGALAQGTVRFDNNIPGLLVTHVYVPPANVYQKYGNAPNDTPPGTQDYTGFVLLEGEGWSAQLWGAPGADRSSLEPALPITTFQTGANAGFVVPVTATFANIPPDTAVATLQLRIWNNAGGTITNWNQASGNPGSGRPFASLSFNVSAIGGQVNPPAPLIGLQSFSGITPEVPEPSTSILVSFGLVALWLRSRRGGGKQR